MKNAIDTAIIFLNLCKFVFLYLRQTYPPHNDNYVVNTKATT